MQLKYIISSPTEVSWNNFVAIKDMYSQRANLSHLEVEQKYSILSPVRRCSLRWRGAQGQRAQGGGNEDDRH